MFARLVPIDAVRSFDLPQGVNECIIANALTDTGSVPKCRLVFSNPPATEISVSCFQASSLIEQEFERTSDIRLLPGFSLRFRSGLRWWPLSREHDNL
jgi:hypothetical protein